MLVNAFPLGPSEPHNIAKDAFLRFVPPRERSLQLFEVYYTHTVMCVCHTLYNVQPCSSLSTSVISLSRLLSSVLSLILYMAPRTLK